METGWLPRSEVYGEAISDWIQLSRYRFDFVTHVPPLAAWMKRLRSLGSRPVPYVTMYQLPMQHIYQGMELRKHADWIEVDSGGNWKRNSFWDSEDQKNWYVTCPNVEGYVRAILKHVESLMEAGAGGIFVDNIGARQPCFGPSFGAHEHIHDDQVKAFSSLLKRAREVIRRHDPEGVLLLNSASPESLPEEYWEHADADMAESYICTWVSQERWFDWHSHWNAMGRKTRKHLDQGKAVLALSYLGHTKNPIKDDAYFCYCSARLSGFLWSAGGDVLKGDPAEVLYSIRLGEPLGPEEERGDVHFRRFERGLVAVNPEKTAGEVLLEAREGQRVIDVYEDRAVGDWGIQVLVSVPAESGRVYLYIPDQPGPDPQPHTLKIVTSPPLGNVRFLIDGVEAFTHSGRWLIAYDKGPDYGTLVCRYAKPGRHTVEASDLRPKGLEISKGYGSIEKLGRLMDPAEPTRPMEGAGYEFRNWMIHGKDESKKALQFDVRGMTELTAVYTRPGRS